MSDFLSRVGKLATAGANAGVAFGGAAVGAGVSLLQQASIVPVTRNESSDEEDAVTFQETEEYIFNGQSGVLVFKTTHHRSGITRMIHINLFNGIVMQYSHRSRKRLAHCTDIENISRDTGHTVSFEIKKNGLLQRHKKLVFENEADAARFHKYVEFFNECGTNVRKSFNKIDAGKTGTITFTDLRLALEKVDLPASDEDVRKMLGISAPDDESVFSYEDWFHLFTDSFVSNLRECLLEWMIQATSGKVDTAQSSSYFYPLPGEVVAFAPNERVYWCVFGGKITKNTHFLPGWFYVTNFRLVLFSARRSPADRNAHSRYDVPGFFNTISIPLTSLFRVYSAAPRNSIYLVCKDYRTIRITLSGFESNKNKVDTFLQVLTNMAFLGPANDDIQSLLYAFKYTAHFDNADKGWNICDLIKEYVRQGIYDCKEWKVVDNSAWDLVETYPRYLVLPSALSREEISQAASFRSKNRLPAVTYRHAKSGAVLSRSAQPMVGMTMKSSSEDALLLNLYRTKGIVYDRKEDEDRHSKLFILDARGKMAATLNMAVGKGTENVSLLDNTELIFCNIENIHVMRNSSVLFGEALSSQSSSQGSSNSNDTDSSGGATGTGIGGGFFTKLEESGWIKHVRLVLMAGVLAAEKLHFDRASVLVHCSDGWDRTAQICGVAQLLLDPYFRTIEGFAVLIEKEWCAFGHKFHDRCGHGADSTVLPDERSPVFVQFMDTVYQLMNQFPTAFEFSSDLLVFLADHIHSCLFGNFLGNCEHERHTSLNVLEFTKSIWSYVLDNRHLFANPSFVPYANPIWPSFSISSIVIWKRFWQRWDISAHPNRLHTSPWHDDW